VLRDHGYRTAAVISGGSMRADQGFANGFDLYDDYSVLSAPLGAEGDVVQSAMDTFAMPTSALTNRAALDWLRRDGNKPFFLLLHYWDVHYDYNPPPPYDDMYDPGYEGAMTGRKADLDTWLFPGCDERDLRHAVALFDGEIRWTDENISAFLAKLRGMGLYDDTLIVLTGDHGEEFLEHGAHGHCHSLLQEVVHVPMIVKLPAPLQPQAPVVEELVSLVDIAPTVLDLLDLPAPEGFTGTSMLPAIRGEGGTLGRPVFSEGVVGKNMCMVRLGEEKLVLDLDTGGSRHYDLSADPMEQSPRPADHETDQELIAAGLAWLEKRDEVVTKEGTTSETIHLTEQELEQLRNMNYFR
jgi:arylsulfatase A-like enzyme